MAIGFGNNILYFFVFLLISLGLTTAVATNKNIENLNPIRFEAPDLFANEKNTVKIYFAEKKNVDSIFEVKAKAEGVEQRIFPEIQRLKPVELFWTPAQRGLVELPQLRFESEFPFRMLRAWRFFSWPQEILIFPQRKGQSHMPTRPGIDGRGKADQSNSAEGLFRDFRDYQKTDSPSRIDWRRSLRLQKPLVKNFEEGGERKVLIDWELSDFLTDFEERVSQMALWLSLSEEKQVFYALRIKSEQSDFSYGPEHLRSCLKKLALLKESDLQ